MKAPLFELIILLLYISDGNFESVSEPNKKKGNKGISYDDLKGISMGFDNIKNDKVVYETNETPKNASLKQTL